MKARRYRAASYAAVILSLLLVSTPSWARDGFVVDWQGAEQTPTLAASLEKQIEEVEAAPVSPQVMDFFQAQKLTVDKPGAVEHSPSVGRAGPNGVFFQRKPIPADNPVLLHELIHRWQYDRMPAGRQNPDVIRFFRQAKASGKWPADSYMLKNPIEFFAMTASTVLHGRTARPPYTREAVKEKAPELYAFIIKEFGVTGL